MKKTLLVSLATATLLLSDANAASTMYDRFEAMEKEMKKLKAELADLKAKEASSEKATMQKADAEEDDSEDKPVASKSSDDDEGDDEPTVDEKISDMQESIDNLNRRTGGNHLKFNVDLRTAVENIGYKMADGSTQGNDAFMTNRLWLGMNWAATKNISFTAQLAYNKAYGARSGANAANSSYETFDWITNENAYDDTVRVKSAYFFYKNNTFLGTDIPWTFSVGRRPSTNGHLVNFRDDDHAASPMGHTINVEFDGLSSKFSLEKLTGISGMYVKFCAGRGGTNAQPKFSAAPYSKNANDTNDIDLAGLIFVPYDDGQYKIGTQFYYANNLIDAKDATNPALGFENVGGLYSETINFVANGIGDEWSDFLDNSIFFISGAWSQTNPNGGLNSMGQPNTMLGSTEAKDGYSVWAGIQIPSLISEDGKWGLEFNHGSQYWRSITYAEDTTIGSKLAARGNAYEAYFTEPLIDNILSLQVRYTYIDYDYTGSNGFFGGQTGTPMKISDIASTNPMAANIVDKAQDIRFYLRYRY